MLTNLCGKCLALFDTYLIESMTGVCICTVLVHLMCSVSCWLIACC